MQSNNSLIQPSITSHKNVTVFDDIEFINAVLAQVSSIPKEQPNVSCRLLNNVCTFLQ